ncbi:5788_t:CDS:1, partial [Dentiscutata erythropus]
NTNNNTNIIEEQDSLYNEIQDSLQKELNVDSLTLKALFDNSLNKNLIFYVNILNQVIARFSFAVYYV